MLKVGKAIAVKTATTGVAGCDGLSLFSLL